MELPQMMEQYSASYLRVVAATAGLTLYEPEVDDDSVDFGVAATGGRQALAARPRVELQLKCTSRDVLSEDHVAFRLPIKNYDDLRLDELLVPRILVVVLAPGQPADWLIQTEEELLVRHCAYWMSLRGRPAVSNANNVTVHVPRAQLLGPPALQQMMDRINAGGLP